jgi:hypothetical protein
MVPVLFISHSKILGCDSWRRVIDGEFGGGGPRFLVRSWWLQRQFRARWLDSLGEEEEDSEAHFLGTSAEAGEARYGGAR